MKRKVLKNIMLLVIVCIFLLNRKNGYEYIEVVNANEVISVYEYSIVPGDDKWVELETVDDKIEACRIPQETLENMTDQALIQAVLDYPFICDVFAYDEQDLAIRSLEKNCDAYSELIRRDSGKDSLINTIEKRNENKKTSRSLSAKDEVENDILSIITVFQSDFTDELKDSEIYLIAEFSNVIGYMPTSTATGRDIIVDADNTDIFTPNGSPVPYFIKECGHDIFTYHYYLDNQTAEAYGVEIISQGTCVYNCHSYAWYNQSTSNHCWITFPIPYMTDGSYSKVLSSLSSASYDVALGDKVFYGTNFNPTHSAIVSSSISGMPLANRMVKSKWGSLGVFKHEVTNVPPEYDIANVSAWH